MQNNTDALTRTVEDMREETTRTLSVSMSSMSSQMLSLATAAASTAASLRGDQSSLEATTSNQLSASISTMLSASVSTTARMADVTQTLNSSIQVAITAANNAATPSVYVQWGQKRCTSPSNNVAVRTLCECITAARKLTPVPGFGRKPRASGPLNLFPRSFAPRAHGFVRIAACHPRRTGAIRLLRSHGPVQLTRSRIAVLPTPRVAACLHRRQRHRLR